MRSRVLTLAVIATALGQLLLAQVPATPTGGQEPLPTFRTGIEVIQLDVIVTDADGNPVKDLSSDEFVILENGTPRPVTAFSFVDIPITAGHGPVEQWAVRPDVVANDGPEERLYLIALDEVAPGNALRTRHFLRRFLEQHFQPNDMAAVVLTGRGLVTDGQPFTSDPRLVLAAVDKFSGGFLAGPECDAAWQFTPGPSIRTLPMPRSNTSDPLIRNRLAQLRQLTEQLAQMPGGRVRTSVPASKRWTAIEWCRPRNQLSGSSSCVDGRSTDPV